MQNAMICFVRSCCTAALLLAAPSGVCIAQSFESGVKVGANAARLPGLELHEGPGEAEIDAKFRVGLVAGAFVAFNLTERFAVQPEVLFSRKGSRFEGHTEDPLPVKASMTLDYVQMPVLARLSIPSRGPHAAYLLAGPALGFSVGTSFRLKIGGQSRDEDISEDIAKIEASFVVGGGVHLGHLLVEGRYTQGLTRIREPSRGQKAARNMVVSFMTGFRF
jgi:outer membrane protein with beta-barrel domain